MQHALLLLGLTLTSLMPASGRRDPDWKVPRGQETRVSLVQPVLSGLCRCRLSSCCTCLRQPIVRLGWNCRGLAGVALPYKMLDIDRPCLAGSV